MFGKVPELPVSFAERIDTADADVLQFPLVEREELPALPRDIQTAQKIARSPQPSLIRHAADIGLGRGQHRDVIVDDFGGRQQVL